MIGQHFFFLYIWRQGQGEKSEDAENDNKIWGQNIL